VAVDHPRKDGRAAQIDHSSLGRDLHRWTDISDTVALDQNDLVVQHRAGFGIEHSTGADRHKILRRRQVG
jgi:hypothetical protein